MLALGMQTHLAPKRVTERDIASQSAQPTTGIVPGFGQANVWAKVKLAPARAQVVNDTQAQIEQYVDDVASRQEGKRASAQTIVCRASEGTLFGSTQSQDILREDQECHLSKHDPIAE